MGCAPAADPTRHCCRSFIGTLYEFYPSLFCMVAQPWPRLKNVIGALLDFYITEAGLEFTEIQSWSWCLPNEVSRIGAGGFTGGLRVHFSEDMHKNACKSTQKACKSTQMHAKACKSIQKGMQKHAKADKCTSQQLSRALRSSSAALQQLSAAPQQLSAALSSCRKLALMGR